jgi:hypothetical protein
MLHPITFLFIQHIVERYYVTQTEVFEVALFLYDVLNIPMKTLGMEWDRDLALSHMKQVLHLVNKHWDRRPYDPSPN